MNAYQRMFGAGPRGTVFSVLLLAAVYMLEDKLGLGLIFSGNIVKYSMIWCLCLMGGVLLIWSIQSLPPSQRGKELVTAGAFRYLQHPLYAAFLLFFNVALALFMNDWIYLVWALLLFPLWRLNVIGEEAIMREAFGAVFEQYRGKTARFIPKIF